MSKLEFTCLEGHTEGMPVRMIIDGDIPKLSGKTMLERREHFISEFDWIRCALMLEPHGHSAMSGTLFYPPISGNADFSLLFIETSGCLFMCGHATIGSITFALETGLIKPKVAGKVVVDVPAGQVSATFKENNGKIEFVRFTNVPSFLLYKDLQINLPALEDLNFDVAYGGNFYPIIEAQENFKGCENYSSNQLLEWGWQIQNLINQNNDKYKIIHPEDSSIFGVKHCMWTGKPLDKNSHGRSVVIGGKFLIDRSPCGTGTSARVAQRFFRGLLAKNEEFIHESIIGSHFIGRVEESINLKNGNPAILPSIEGQAYLIGKSQRWINKFQNYWNGFDLNDF